MEGKKQLIAIWGSGGSGKTIASVKLGNALAKRKNNVILVSADENLPMVPLLMPNAKESDKEKTLGKIWAMGDFSQEDVLEQCVMFTGENRYSLLAYDMYDKRNNHTSEMAADLIFTLKQTVDFVIIDCCTNFLENPLSLAALQRSDYILKVMNPDPKSILETRRYAMDFKDIGDFYQHINILNNIYPWEDVKDFYDGIGKMEFKLPHIEALKEQYASGELLQDLGGKIGEEYQDEMLMIGQKVLFGGEINAETT